MNLGQIGNCLSLEVDLSDLEIYIFRGAQLDKITQSKLLTKSTIS